MSQLYKLKCIKPVGNFNSGDFYPRIFQNFDSAFVFRQSELRPAPVQYKDCLLPLKKPTTHNWEIVKQ